MIGATWPRLSLLALTAAILWGCGGMKSASSPWYQSPANVTAVNGATVSKSDNQAGGTIPDGDTHVVAVDGTLVSAIDTDKVLLSAGQHTLGVKYDGIAAAATVQIQADLRPGHTYEVKAERTGPCDANVWLEGQGSHEMSSAKIETHLTAKPSPYGSSVFAVACE
jgi:hypothetical protein